MAGFRNDVVYGINVDFTGNEIPTAQVLQDGQLLIGSVVSPNIRVNTLTAGSGITITNGNGTITISSAGGGGGVDTITGNTGGPISPSGGNINLLNSGTTVDIAGSGSTLTQNFEILNLMLGSDAASITSGSSNTGVGYQALNGITTGSSNVALGTVAGTLISSGLQNTAIGDSCLESATTAQNNVAVGHQALKDITLIAGSRNTAIGTRSLLSITTGAENTCLGMLSGQNYLSTESNNICIGYNVSGSAGESNAIRIGNASNTTCFITGIDGVNVGSVAKVLTMASNQIGTATITAGSGVTVTPGANTITIACTGGGIVWSEVTGTSQNAAVNSAYVANNAALVTITLPSTFAVGDVVRVAGLGAGLWRLAANTGDIINFGSSPTSAGGSLTATNRYDCVEVVGVAANATWVVLSAVGNLTVA